MENTENKEPLLSRQEVISLFRINPVTLWRYTRSGKLPFYRIQRKMYFLRSEILLKIQNNKTINNDKPEPKSV